MCSTSKRLDDALILEGRAFKAKLRRNCHARQQCLASLVRTSSGWWAGRVGGPKRGELHMAPRRDVIEKAIHCHYNRIMLAWVQARRRR